jgi:GTP 3',8-cyclase
MASEASPGPSGVAPILDTLGRGLSTLRLSVIDRCNFRCPYCMPKAVYGDRYVFLPEREWLTFPELERLVRVFTRVGVRALRVTGGEPLLRPGLPELLTRLSGVEGIESLALTTNGSLLEGAAPGLKAAGLRRVTVSLDSLDAGAFALLSGVDAQVAPVLRGLERAREVGLSPVKLNAVVVRGVNDSGVVDLVRRFRHTGVVVRFIEYMDVGTRNHWRSAQVVTTAELVERISRELPLEPLPRSAPDDTAERYRLLDGSSELGFVSSISRPFCRACTRARLSTDGRLFTCLFASQGLDLKTPLRSGASDEALVALISQAWVRRTDRYSELRAGSSSAPTDPKVEMFQVGG